METYNETKNPNDAKEVDMIISFGGWNESMVNESRPISWIKTNDYNNWKLQIRNISYGSDLRIPRNINLGHTVIISP